MPKGAGDGLMGRRLSGLVRRSPLALLRVDVHVRVDTHFVEGWPGWNRATEIASTLVAPFTVLREPLARDDVERWLADLRTTAEAGAFFFSELALVVEAVREPSGTRAS